MIKFNPEKSMQGLDKRIEYTSKRSKKYDRYKQKKVKNLAKHAVRMAHKGMVNELVPAKMTGRLSPFGNKNRILTYQHLDGEVIDDEASTGLGLEAVERANELLAEQGLELEVITADQVSSSYDPTLGMVRIKLLMDNTEDNRGKVPTESSRQDVSE